MVLEKIKEVDCTRYLDQITVRLDSEVTPQEFGELMEFLDNAVELQLQQRWPEANPDKLREFVLTRTYTIVPDENHVILYPEPGFEREFSYAARVLRACSRVGRVSNYQELEERLTYQLGMLELEDSIRHMPLEAGKWQKYLGLG